VAAAVLIVAVSIGGYMISTTPAPTTPTPTAQLPSPTVEIVQVELLDSTMYRDYRGYVTIVGEVQNTGNVPLQSVLVASELKDENGTVIDKSWTITMLSTLAPGEKSPFKIKHLEKDIQPADYTVRIADYKKASNMPYRSYKIFDVNSYITKEERGVYKVEGKVTNTVPRDTDETMVVGTFYNTEGKVVAATFYSTDPPFMRSGKTASFTLRVLSPAEPLENIASYNLTVQGEVE